MTQDHCFEQCLNFCAIYQVAPRATAAGGKEFSSFSVTSDSCDLLVLWLIFSFNLFF